MLNRAETRLLHFRLRLLSTTYDTDINHLHPHSDLHVSIKTFFDLLSSYNLTNTLVRNLNEILFSFLSRDDQKYSLS